jgi:hypothetical protein
MFRPQYLVTAFAVLVSFTLASKTYAADPVVTCESGKLKESAKYSSCRLKADSKGLKKGIAPDYTKCESKFAEKWAKIEGKAGLGTCPTEDDQLSMDARITTDAAEIATLLAGGSVAECGDDLAEGNESCDGTDLGGETCASLGFLSGPLACTAGCGFDLAGCTANPPPVDCGNGTIDSGEECDFGNLGGETCTSQLGTEALGTLACTPGTCLFDTSGCQAQYEQQNVNGDPTVVDHATGLEWVVTDDSGGIRDKDNFYSWSADNAGRADGTLFTVYLAGLNGANYGGHNDWRIPTSKGGFGREVLGTGELESIVDLSFSKCIDETLFGPVTAHTWSSTITGDTFQSAWSFVFSTGCGLSTGARNGSAPNHARAVRGGLGL